jgi:hypothetical protein
MRVVFERICLKREWREGEESNGFCCGSSFALQVFSGCKSGHDIANNGKMGKEKGD